MIPFAKAHACGNDFLIVNEDAAVGYDPAELARRLCARNTGVGADGVEFFAWKIAEPSQRGAGRIRLYNADGSIAEISGNGTRCVAAWMAEELDSKAGDDLAIECKHGCKRILALTDGDARKLNASRHHAVVRFIPCDNHFQFSKEMSRKIYKP